MKKIALLIFFIGFSLLSFSQQNDSVTFLKESFSTALSDSSKFEITTKIAKYFESKNKDSAKYYYQKAYQIAINSKNIDLEINALKNFGIFNFRNLSYSNAIINFNEALKICHINCDKAKEADLYNYLGYCYMYLYDENKSYENFIKSLNIDKSISNKKGIAENYTGIGSLFYNQENYEFAQKYFRDALNINMKLKDSAKIASNYINLGNALSDAGAIEKGLTYYKKSIKILKQLNDKIGEGINYNNISDCYKELKNYNKANNYLNKALQIAEKEDDARLLAIVYLNKATIEHILNHNNLAIKYALKSNLYADKIKDIVYKANNYNTLAKAFKNKGNFKKAYFYADKYNTIKDSLNKFDKHKTTQLFKSLSQLEDSNSKIDRLAIENERVKIKNKNDRKFIYGLIIVITIFAILVFFINIQYTKKQEAFNLLEYQNFKIKALNDEIEQQKNDLENLINAKDRLFSIIGHDLRNPFNSIKGFADLLIENGEVYTESKKNNFLKIISNSALRASELLNNLLLWANSQTGKVAFKPEKLALNEQILDVIYLLEAQALGKDIEIKTKLAPAIFVKADKNMVNTILRNLISNAIKFTNKKGLIKIESKVLKTEVEVSIKDNGVGILKEDIDNLFNISNKKTTNGTAEEKGSGLGLVLVKEFIKKNKGKLKVTSKPNKGSTFKFTLPLWID
jgi:signal transduction histidine kinase/tetratricopeptide (TPR) repeat protein